MNVEYTRDPVSADFPRSGYHWPSIVAGAFMALALFVVSVVLARACDVDITFTNAHSTAGEAGAIIWGGVAAFICFGIGGLIAGRGAAAAGFRGTGLNGLLVWAVAVPVLVYFLGSGTGPRLGQGPELGQGKGAETAAAVEAGARMNGEITDANIPATTGSPNIISHPQAAAWWMLVSLGVGLIGAAALGGIGGASQHHINRVA